MKGACNQPVCGVCGWKLVKNGSTSAGRTRWRCQSCGASTTQTRPDVTAKAEARLFRRWLLEEFSARQLGVAKTSFTNKTHWCWHVEVPKPQVTGEVYDQVLLDGIYLAYGWCLITATNGEKIIDWQWCQRENSAAYQALMNRLPAPTVVLTDGGAGIAKALRLTWPQSRIQRCLFHIRANTITDLTHNPQNEAGKTLLGLANQLMGVKTPEDAGKWLSLLQHWYRVYRDYINEKTYTTEPGSRKWWWTHKRVRKAYKRLERLARFGYLFTWLDPKLTGLDIQRTTSRLEGGVNAPIRRLLNTHRGLSEPHMKTAVEWLLNQKSIDPADPITWLTHHRHNTSQPKPQPTANNPIGPTGYDTAIDYNPAYQDGSLHIRKGWAGR